MGGISFNDKLQNTISKYDPSKQLLKRYFTFFFYVFEIWYAFYMYGTSHFELVTF